ncbi:GHMP kinase [Acerihabitans sp. TG2]|uniref:GHMP family kinase ATP-binding protein n=1 Tax=Acerihabitans sp. TG2 TaxID=3096008 RepID=UPI002B235124|nr:GHMP kinase [Acerihabitans sp. TG2]MEA9389348.1 GHMP kinase [Acerihabitans sp. TG2]
MAEARCPASCGELIQGWIAGGEKLISCPIDWYSEVEVREGDAAGDERQLSRRMLNQVIKHFGYRANDLPPLRIECRSTIPIAKGLASSTADIAATAVATARLLRQSLDEATLARLCLQIEPTDSTIFRALTLFDHRHGECCISCHWQPSLDILILESAQTLTTADFHRRVGLSHLQRQAHQLDKSWRQFQLASRSQSLRRLGEAAMLSACASNQYLPKPAFDGLRRVVEQQDLYGINVAHSGTVVGLLFDHRQHDPQQLLARLDTAGILLHYPHQHVTHLVAGGVS